MAEGVYTENRSLENSDHRIICNFMLILSAIKSNVLSGAKNLINEVSGAVSSIITGKSGQSIEGQSSGKASNLFGNSSVSKAKKSSLGGSSTQQQQEIMRRQISQQNSTNQGLQSSNIPMSQTSQAVRQQQEASIQARRYRDLVKSSNGNKPNQN